MNTGVFGIINSKEAINIDYGEKIAKLREKSKMSQEELANCLFVSRDLVSKWENNKRNPDRPKLEEMCRIFSVDIDYFESSLETFARELSGCIPKGLNLSAAGLDEIMGIFLESLSERDRCVFVRRYYFLESADVIGGKYGLSTAHILVILSRCRKKLHNFLKERSGQYA